MKARISKRNRPPKNPNPLCVKCTGYCKQEANVEIVVCPKYNAVPVQLEIWRPGFRKPRKKRATA